MYHPAQESCHGNATSIKHKTTEKVTGQRNCKGGLLANSGLIVNALDSGLRGLGWSTAGHCVVFFGILTVPLTTQLSDELLAYMETN